MGLKADKGRYQLLFSRTFFQIKSDQNGIESRVTES